MNTFFSAGARFDRPMEGGLGRSVLRLAPAFSAGEDHQHDIVDEPDDARVEVDYFLVGTAPKAETDGEMSLARAAGLATELDDAKASADRWLGIRYGATSTPGRPTCARAAPGFPAPGRGRGCR